MPSIKQLQYFCALAYEQNMGRLATKLYVSQTALSNSISRLENELGVTLFDRTTSGLLLTKSGEIYLLYAEKILALFEEANSTLNSLQKRTRETLSVAFNSPILYGDLLASFMSQFPSYTVTQQTCDIDSIQKTLPNMEVDVILAGMNDFVSPYLEHAIVSTDRIYVSVPTSHRFADRKIISLEECKDEAFIFQPKETGFSRFSYKLFQDAGYEPNIVAWCDYTMRKKLFEQKIGITLTSDAIRRADFFDDCVYIPLYPNIQRKMALFWRKDKKLSESAEAFINYTCTYFETLDIK